MHGIIGAPLCEEPLGLGDAPQWAKGCEGSGLEHSSILVVYCSADESWKDRVIAGLDLDESLVQTELWTETRESQICLENGDGLANFRAALLLLTPAFVTSAPLREHTLPRLAARVPQGLEIFSFWLEACAWQTIEEIARSRLILFNDKPLERANDKERSEAFAAVQQRLGEMTRHRGERAPLTEADKQALYRDLFEQHYRGVFYFFARRGFQTEECRDLAQETFLRVYRGLDSYRSEAAMGTWIRSITRNLWLNRLRDAGARKRQASRSLPRAGPRKRPGA